MKWGMKFFNFIQYLLYSIYPNNAKNPVLAGLLEKDEVK